MRYTGKLILDPYYRYEEKSVALFRDRDSLDREDRRHTQGQKDLRESRRGLVCRYPG